MASVMELTAKIFFLLMFGLHGLNVIKCFWIDASMEYFDSDEYLRIVKPNSLAKIEMYPFMASIILVSPSRTSEKFHCAGFQAPIRGTVIITAGSCVSSLIRNRIAVTDVVVRTNSEYWQCNCGISMEYNVRGWTVHPEYQEHIIPFQESIYENDIGMIALDGEWTGVYNKNATLGMVPNMEIKDWNVPTTVVGWGYSGTSPVVQKGLMELRNMKIIRERACKKTHYKKFFPPNSFCILHSSKQNRGPCVYDQGGPLIWINHTAWNGDFARIVNILGIVSNAPSCKARSSPPIILNITHYLPFIRDRTWLKYLGNTQEKARLAGYVRSWWKPGVDVERGWFRGGF